jgi:hypothetical protein
MGLKGWNWGRIGVALFLLLGLLACERKGLGQEPLVEVTIERPGNEWRVMVQNNHSSSVTGIMVRLQAYGAKPQVLSRDFRAMRTDLIGTHQKMSIYTTAGSLSGIDFLGAVFADGTTYGEAEWPEKLMHTRWVVFSAADALQGAMCKDIAMGLPADDAMRAISSSFTNPDYAAIATGTGGADYQAADWTLKQIYIMYYRNGESMEAMIQDINKWGKAMAEDPVKDSTGKPYITMAPDDLTCAKQKAPAPK